MKLLVTGLVLGGFALAGISAPAGARTAKYPNPSTSWLYSDSAIVFCPAGEDTFTFVARDLANNTIYGVSIELDFCNCPEVAFCPPNGSENYTFVSGCRIRVITDRYGIAKFPIRGGGICAASNIQVWGGPVFQGWPRRQCSPDQNGDLVVDGADAAIVGAKLGTADPSADFNFDGRVTAADSLLLEIEHAGHSCTRATPARAPSWGGLKLRYR